MKKLKGLIIYYSITGNTKLVCDYLVARINQVQFDLVNISLAGILHLAEYDVIGFAFPTNHLSVPEKLLNLVNSIENQDDKVVFLINVYSMMQGKGIKILEQLLKRGRFRVVACHALLMPESYPPFIAKGLGGENQPNEKQLADFNLFIENLSTKLDRLFKGERLEEVRIKIDLFSQIIGAKTRLQALKEMGQIVLDSNLCNLCGVCIDSCNYGVIQMKEKPTFTLENCRACWSCYNHCPQKAISTQKLKSNFQYVHPKERLFQKFKTNSD